MKLQPGDYVSTEGMTEEEYHAVCRAFIEAGACVDKNNAGYPRAKWVIWDVTDERLFCPSHGMTDYRNHETTVRELTKDQILGAQKMDIKEAYKLMQDNCGIEVGDTVKVLRKAEAGEMGWENLWNSEMDKLVGKIGEVQRISDTGIRVYCDKLKDWYYFPFFVLELLEKGKKLPDPIKISSSYDATFNEDGSIYVGCQHIAFNTIEKIYHAAKGVIVND